MTKRQKGRGTKTPAKMSDKNLKKNRALRANKTPTNELHNKNTRHTLVSKHKKSRQRYRRTNNKIRSKKTLHKT